MAAQSSPKYTEFARLCETAAGYHPPVVVGTVYTLFGHCATPLGHAGCPEWLEVGVTSYACDCPHHRPAEWGDETPPLQENRS